MFYKVQFFKQVELSRRGLFFKLWGTQASTLECWAGVSLQIGGGGVAFIAPTPSWACPCHQLWGKSRGWAEAVMLQAGATQGGSSGPAQLSSFSFLLGSPSSTPPCLHPAPAPDLGL